jgi:hypothetical protein
VYLLFLHRYDERGEGTSLRSEVKKLNVTSHQKLRTVSLTSTAPLGVLRIKVRVRPEVIVRRAFKKLNDWPSANCLLVFENGFGFGP